MPPERPSSSFFFCSRRRHTRSLCDWSSDVCSSDLRPRTDEINLAILVFALALTRALHRSASTTAQRDARRLRTRLQPRLHVALPIHVRKLARAISFFPCRSLPALPLANCNHLAINAKSFARRANKATYGDRSQDRQLLVLFRRPRQLS